MIGRDVGVVVTDEINKLGAANTEDGSVTAHLGLVLSHHKHQVGAVSVHLQPTEVHGEALQIHKGGPHYCCVLMTHLCWSQSRLSSPGPAVQTVARPGLTGSGEPLTHPTTAHLTWHTG